MAAVFQNEYGLPPVRVYQSDDACDGCKWDLAYAANTDHGLMHLCLGCITNQRKAGDMVELADPREMKKAA